MNTSIFVTFQKEGLHRWVDADNYLQHPHRHIFHLRVEASVDHDNREIEFITFKRELATLADDIINPGYVIPDSCEIIAKRIIKYLQRVYGDRDYVVEVSEDGENGAKVSCSRGTCR